MGKDRGIAGLIAGFAANSSAPELLLFPPPLFKTLISAG
jgi:hypothetical protein